MSADQEIREHLRDDMGVCVRFCWALLSWASAHPSLLPLQTEGEIWQLSSLSLGCQRRPLSRTNSVSFVAPRRWDLGAPGLR
jgi:hypothetical protein